jgi:hypothetical protein
MVKNFLKIAGVKTQKEFYDKYPSEEAFFRAHPEAMHLIHQKMAYGGGIYAYQVGGEPVLEDYQDYGSYQAAHDAWLASQNTPQVDQSTIDAYNMPAAGTSGLPDYLRAPQAMPASPVTAPTDPHAYDYLGAPPSGGGSAPQATASGKGRNYKGVSVVDYLKSIGMSSDFEDRRQMAETKGISGYRGTAEQNLALLAKLRGEQPQGGGQGDGSSPQAGGRPVPPQHVSLRDEFGNPDNNGSAGSSTPVKDDNGNWIWPAVGLAGAGAAGYGALKYGELPGTLKSAQAASDLSKANLTTDQLIAYAKKFGRDPETWHLLKARGMNDIEIAKALKGARGPIAAPVPAKLEDVVKTTNDLLSQFKKGSEAENLANAKRLVQVLKDKNLPRNQEVLDKLVELLPNPATRMQVLKGVRFPEATATAAETAKNATTFAKNVRNAIPPGGGKAAEAAGKVANAAAEVVEHPGILRDMWGAFRGAPMLKYVAKLGKFFKEEGGPVDDLELLHHNYLQNGGYYQDGGDPTAWHIGSYEVPSWLKTTAQVLDPTGISSYGDAGRAISNAWNNPSWGSVGTAALETLGALPIVGKVGKAAKVAKAVAEGEKVSKVAKATGALGKAYRFAEKGLTPVAAIDRFNPVGAAVAKGMESVVAKTPNKIARGALKIGSDINQGRRFGTAASAGEDSIDKYFGFTPQTGLAAPSMSGSGVPYDAPAQKYGGQQYAQGGAYGNVPQHGHPGTYADGYSGTSSGGQYFQDGGFFGMLRDTNRDGTLQGLASNILGMTGQMQNATPINNTGTQQKTGNLKEDLLKVLNGYQAGGAYNPTSVDYSQGLPHFDVGATMPQAMYGMGMAYGGPTYSDVTQYNHQQHVPAFDWMGNGGTPCYNCGGMYDQGGMYPDGRAIVNRGPYEGRALVNAYAQGGLVKGSVHDMSHDQIQDLINQGYNIEYL